jgi:predicted site-specific integrase-resolvase
MRMAFLKLKPAAVELGVAYYWLREQAVKGSIPAMRTAGDKGTWIVNVEQVRESMLKQAAQ